MSSKFKILVVVGLIGMMVLAGCVPATAPSAPAAPTAAPAAAEPTAAPAAGGENKPLNIAVIVKSVTSAYWKTVGVGVEAAMKADPTIKASFLGPNEETDIEGQIRIIESQISAKVDAIAIAPSQADQVQPTLEKAVQAGIPVATFGPAGHGEHTADEWVDLASVATTAQVLERTALSFCA